MTPEEQFMKIENALRHAAEIQARHAEAIERDEAAIRDLIRVSRSLVDTAKLHSEQIAATNQALNDSFQRAEEQRERDREKEEREREKRERERERDRERDREDFNAKFNALVQAQLETEQKLQRWIDRHGQA